MHYIRPNNHGHISVCFYSRHMPFIMEHSNPRHTILLPPLPAGSTLYLYLPSICSISDNRSLHLEHTLPETCATRASSGPLSPHWHTCGCEMPRLSFEATEMMASNDWAAVKEWVVSSEHIHLSMMVIFTPRFSESWMAVMFFMFLIKQLDSLIVGYSLKQHRWTIFLDKVLKTFSVPLNVQILCEINALQSTLK